jgi:hypothetical protein
MSGNFISAARSRTAFAYSAAFSTLPLRGGIVLIITTVSLSRHFWTSAFVPAL